MVSRPVWIGLAGAVAAIVLLRVPGRVEEQRRAVAGLAAQRAASVAGSALLTRILDLERAPLGDEAWRFPAGHIPTPVVIPPGADWARTVAALREARAERAAAALPEDSDVPTIVTIEGDPFLVVPGARHAEVPPIPPAPPAAAIAPPAPPSTTDTPPSPATTDTPVAPPAPPTIRVLGQDHPIQVEIAGELPPLDEVLDPEDRAQLEALHWLAPLDTAWSALRESAVPAAPERAPVDVIVAWWPPIQYDVELTTGLSLQLGGTPPAGRSVLPASRLRGETIWSLPTHTKAAVTLLDGGGLAVLSLALGTLVWQIVGLRRDANRAIERGQARDAVMQRISHELRTPVAAVQALLDASATATEAERPTLLDLARTEAGRLATGVDRLLQATRGEASLRVDPIPLDLTEWADGTRQRWLARLPGLRVRASGPAAAVADPERLDEAVDALLDNAAKYGGPNVVIDVGPGWFAVEDDGPGVPAHDRARVARKFERLEGRAQDPGGHGLGLWAVAEVARAHGGRLTIEGPTRFHVTLRTR